MPSLCLFAEIVSPSLWSPQVSSLLVEGAQVQSVPLLHCPRVTRVSTCEQCQKGPNPCTTIFSEVAIFS